MRAALLALAVVVAGCASAPGAVPRVQSAPGAEAEDTTDYLTVRIPRRCPVYPMTLRDFLFDGRVLDSLPVLAIDCQRKLTAPAPPAWRRNGSTIRMEGI